MRKFSSLPADPALISTLHDPAGRMLPALLDRGKHLRWYAATYVAATSSTDPRMLDALRSLDVRIEIHPPGIAGAAQRSVLGAAVAAGHASILCCDFDRWLHWVGRFPEELAALPTRVVSRRPAPWYVCVGRTARAFKTHPAAQQLPEAATNQALSLTAGRRLDAIAGACWLSKEGAALILADSIETTKATDLEWPALVLRADRRRLAGLWTEGLEFETAEFYSDEIAAAGGLTTWIAATYDRPEGWRDRLRLAADSVDALTRVLSDDTDGV
jgi:hypothetical protein